MCSTVLPYAVSPCRIADAALPEFFRELQEYRMLAFGGAMVAIMVWRPQGLLAHRVPTLRLGSRGPPRKEGS